MESIRSLRSVFANPALRRLELAAVGSFAGAWGYTVALALFAFDAGGATAVGIAMLCRMLPAALTAPFIAVISDRRPRRQVMLTADLGRVCLISTCALIAAADGPPAIVYALAGVSGMFSAAFAPAEAAMLPGLARSPEELTAANATSSTIESVGSFAGPAIGGALVAAGGPALGFSFTAAMFAWSAAMVWRIAEPQREREEPVEPESIAGEVTAGFRALGSGGPITLLVGLYGLQTLVAGVLDVLVVVVALDLADMGQGGVGTLFAVMGVGGLVGAAIVLPLAHGTRLAATFAAGMLLWGLPIVLIAGWSTPLGAIVALAAVGVGNTLVDVSALTLLQRAVPEDVLARAFGVLESVFVGTIGLGGVLAPVLVSAFGAEGALVATGLVLPAATALAWRRLRAIDRASQPPAGTPELLRGVPMLAVLPEPVLESLVAAVERVAVAAGDAVITRGEEGDRFYVVASGSVDVQEAGVALGPGESFGEIALLHEVPRTATVVATEPTELLRLDRDTFIAAVTGHAPSRAAAESVVATRLGGLRAALGSV
jgi:MFS family permease